MEPDDSLAYRFKNLYLESKLSCHVALLRHVELDFRNERKYD
jgi:hypothetical protein